MKHENKKRSKLFFYTFLFLVLIIFAQISWWIYFQIRQVDEVYQEMTMVSENERYAAVLTVEEILQTAEYPNAFIIGSVLLDNETVISVMGDTSGFGILRNNESANSMRSGYFNSWRFEFRSGSQISIEKINSREVSNWLDSRFKNLVMNGQLSENRSTYLELENVTVKSEFASQALGVVNKRIRMFIAEGLFFIALVATAIYLLYSTLRKEWLYTHQIHNFMLSVTHELKSPLASIRLYIETLLKHDPDKEKREAFLIRALSDTDRLQDLVENILNASRLESDELTLTFTEVNVSELLEGLVKNGKYIHQSRIICDSSLSGDTWVLGDERHLHSLFNNLIDNALKYSTDNVTLNLTEDKENWIFTITDNGIGISEDYQTLIFERFFRVDDELTRKSIGVGLGLYIVRKIAQLHNGNVTVKSGAGKGSVFSVFLPKIKDSADDSANFAG